MGFMLLSVLSTQHMNDMVQCKGTEGHSAMDGKMIRYYLSDEGNELQVFAYSAPLQLSFQQKLKAGAKIVSRSLTSLY